MIRAPELPSKYGWYLHCMYCCAALRCAVLCTLSNVVISRNTWSQAMQFRTILCHRAMSQAHLDLCQLEKTDICAMSSSSNPRNQSLPIQPVSHYSIIMRCTALRCVCVALRCVVSCCVASRCVALCSVACVVCTHCISDLPAVKKALVAVCTKSRHPKSPKVPVVVNQLIL